ncbi:LEAF RUST 10 DISEASE-RESISTANCE LOCUS RECEPTOR-LIKE PROTEIN KINASE-like 2.5 [Lotus japonicus]|uniref:LEAF RUST 10 DISEASE-RESISTANCE LOCUS RECEPTOR-LIKE PROTEIN KINASE-like 2.5 n=1 Tax=Lotus japonicus TaxID=34305 RepID=UPI002585B8B2|nr:LEAF RUST 10 DISEASE-RESISTANCE LOCUS RECEPTOR-LIKE PROTEIN KINASE-like 2.5 [Lotus japonicus]
MRCLKSDTNAPKEIRRFEVLQTTSIGIDHLISTYDELGDGTIGKVYKGTFPCGYEVVIKILSSSEEDDEDFINEVKSIGKKLQKNVIALFGSTMEGSQKALIYPYMPKWSLEKIIDQEKISLLWDWVTLLSIAKDIAYEPDYLGCNHCASNPARMQCLLRC